MTYDYLSDQQEEELELSDEIKVVPAWESPLPQVPSAA